MILAGTMGFLMYGMGYSIPLLKRDMEITRALASLHQIGLAISITVASFYAPKLLYRFSPRKIMTLGWILTSLSLLVFAFGQSLWVTVPAICVSGMGSTLFNNVNAATLGAASGNSMQVMLRQSGIGTACGAIAPTIIGTLIGAGISWRLTLGAFAVICGLFAVKLMPSIPKRQIKRPVLGERHWDLSLIILVVFSLSANILEAATGSWALDLLISRGVVVSAAVILAAFFSYGIAASRLGFSFSSKVTIKLVFASTLVLSFIGLTLIITSDSPSVTMVGLLVASLGMGPASGLALTLCAASSKGSDAGIAANGMGAGFSIGIGPWIMGFVSDKSGFSTAYLFPVLMLVLMMVFFFLASSGQRKRADLTSQRE